MPVSKNPQHVFNKTVSDIVDELFNIQLSKYVNIKEMIDSSIRNKIIVSEKTYHPGNTRPKIKVANNQRNIINNLIILQGIFTYKDVKKIIESNNVRKEKAKFLQYLLYEGLTITEVSLIHENANTFFELLLGDDSLYDVRLPLPFDNLPQIAIPEMESVLQALAVKNLSFSTSNSMLAYYLNGELGKAWEVSKDTDFEEELLQSLKFMIQKEYHDSIEFNLLLDSLR